MQEPKQENQSAKEREERSGAVARRIRRLALVALCIGLAWTGLALNHWASQPDNGLVVENRRDSSYRNIEFGQWQYGLHNTIRTCNWEEAPVRSEPFSAMNPTGYRVDRTEFYRARQAVLADRIQYSLEHDCTSFVVADYAAGSVMEASGGTSTLSIQSTGACFANSDCRSRLDLMTNSFTQLRTTYLDCRDGEGYPVLGCTERKELERLVEQRLRHIEGGTRRSDFQVQQDAERIVGACLVVTGQACVQQEVTIRSDWDAAARSGAVNQALWFSGIALISLLIGPMAWSLGAATVRRLWR